MQLTCLVEHLSRYSQLTESEVDALNTLASGTRVVRRGSVIRSEHATACDVFVIQRGWLFCSVSLEDGRRQIVSFHSRGDLMGGDGFGFARATGAITALTDAEICLIDRTAFGQLFVVQPRVAALLYTMLQFERVTLTDRLTSLGRNSAKGRVAALLLWVAARLRIVDGTVGDSFTLPMTQEEIGDATGLTAVHVNRTLRVLEQQGLIERTRSLLRLVDPDGLGRVANQPLRREGVQGGWLPPAGYGEFRST